MNREIKKRWVAALRSGKYRQGSGHLRKDGCYCALGVLCDLFVQDREHEGVSWDTTFDEYYFVRYEKDQATYYYEFLNPAVMKWAGVRHENPAFWMESAEEYFTVSDLNDDQTLSFEEIATIIEESPDNDADE
ncbi:hypothetical protein UFOVP401_47 [uncultured Caudovirales phage]|uniref:EF-hand domain-containing protein n=1 Tax=uncultured Caudovirales phage TaxID=2100421 RepID=A0A6J5M660_9CAUD|nr:hypothetical protein UFOVP401_47 [uncultured Caudovirales phage]